MSSRDRTNEFFATADSFRAQMNQRISGAVRPNISMQSPFNSSTVDFKKAASSIRAGISDMSHNLISLKKLAQKRRLFDDKSSEFDALSNDVQKEITELADRVEVLKTFVRKHRSGVSNTADTHLAQVINTFQQQIGAKTNEFSDILKLQTKNIRVQEEKRQKYTKPISQGMRQRRGIGDVYPSSKNGHLSVQLEQEQQQQQQQQQQEPSNHQRRQNNRTDAVRKIEQKVMQIAESFQRVQTMTAIQHEQAQRLDRVTDTILVDVEGGYQEIVGYHNQIRGNRGLILKVFLALILFTIIFVGMSR